MTQEYLKSRLKYCPETGTFVNRKTNRKIGFRKHNRTKTQVKSGMKPVWYKCITMPDGKQHRVHRLAWLYMTGSFPSSDLEIDHKDRDGTNNKWENLRLGTRSENVLNKVHKKRTYPVGVYKSKGGFEAILQKDGIIHRKYFNSVKEASQCRLTWEREFHE